MGLVGLIVIPTLWRTMGATGVAMLILGSLVITIGGIVYAYQRPNPVPRWIGHHELFHAATVVGCGLYLAAMAAFTLH
jgi:hemolysin III